ncbi:MAG: apolipoprotein D and lipocalin family protein [Sulfurimonas sp.]|jgi:apolipoprotein D and lipocalin family protein|uniref:lipocalin family protein n=1 Tax=Sulfurimonas sp. TaxID=2022749 RepID=UPI0039E24DB3
MRIYIFSFLALFFLGCSTNHPTLKTVEKVDINSYLGTWYEIARYEHFFQKGCSDVNATYSLRENGEIDVLNQCMKGDRLAQAKGVAYATDETSSKLKVSFFRPFYGDYWILMLGKNYEYALIGEPSREYLWILSRTPTMDKKLQETILNKLPEFGYSSDKLLWTPIKGK